MTDTASNNFDREENLRQFRLVITGVAARLREMCPQLETIEQPAPETPPQAAITRPAKSHHLWPWEPRKIEASRVALLPNLRSKRPQRAGTQPPPSSWPRLDSLSSSLGLNECERAVIILCVAAELSCEVATLCGLIQRNNRSRPTLELVEQVFHLSPDGFILSPRGKLRSNRLIEVDRSPMDSSLHGGLWLDGRIADFLLGDNRIDERLSRISTLMDIDIRPLAAAHQMIRDRLLALMTVPNRPPSVVQLIGPDLSAKLQLATHCVPNLQLYHLSAEQLPQPADEIETLAALWQREHKLGHVALLVDAQEMDPVGERGQNVMRFVDRLSQSIVCILAVPNRARLSCNHLREDVPRPSPAEQAVAWGTAIASEYPSLDAIEDLSKTLAWKFSLPVPRIFDLAAAAPTDLTRAQLDQYLTLACQDAVRPRLEPLARRINSLATLDDIVLPDAQRQMLLQIVDQVRQRQKVYGDWGFDRRMNRGMGISALFAGESGTGKTMAAEVIANLLNLPMYLIDLSMVVNKYIGETEKNLARVFDAAEDGGGILCFDECDALFGKRSEVKDSHDRYANIEINYLLQRVEAYRGLAILTTNMKSSLDTAFTRRLRFTINFSTPEESQRLEIWKKAFPKADSELKLPGTPVQLTDADYARLARWNLTGATIQSIALGAAFRAAALGSDVTIDLIQSTAREEVSKLGRMGTEIETRPTISVRPTTAAANGRTA